MFAFAALVFPAVYFTTNQPDPLFASAMGSGIVALVGVPFILLSLRDPTKAKALQLLSERPAQSIVWLFSFTTGKRGAGVSINIGFDDGAMTSVTAATAPEATQLFAALAAHAPHASQDFNEELARSFHSSTSPAARRSALGIA